MRELIKNYPMFCFDPSLGTVGFSHTVTVYKEGSNYYQVKHTQPEQLPVDVESLPKPAAPIPLKLFMGRWDSSITEAPHPLPTDSFLKSPPIVLFEDYDEIVARVDEDHESPQENFWAPWHFMAAEAKTYEILKDHPHPNICTYYGCVREGDYFTGLCLKKYARSLDEAVENEDETLDIAKVLDGVSKGLHFLHDTFGLVHGDINSANIMLDDDGNAVIIDFDSCLPIGQEIGSRKAGTSGWVRDEKCTVALPENDWHGLAMLAKFMKEGPDSVIP